MNKKYNTIMPESEGCVLCIMIDKPISAEGYKENYLSRVQKIMEEYGDLRLLVYFKEYHGWEKEAAAMDLASSTETHARVSKNALVNPPPSLIALTQLRKDIRQGETRIFTEEQLQDALKWLKEDQ